MDTKFGPTHPGHNNDLVKIFLWTKLFNSWVYLVSCQGKVLSCDPYKHFLLSFPLSAGHTGALRREPWWHLGSYVSFQSLHTSALNKGRSPPCFGFSTLIQWLDASQAWEEQTRRKTVYEGQKLRYWILINVTCHTHIYKCLALIFQL